MAKKSGSKKKPSAVSDANVPFARSKSKYNTKIVVNRTQPQQTATVVTTSAPTVPSVPSAPAVPAVPIAPVMTLPAATAVTLRVRNPRPAHIPPNPRHPVMSQPQAQQPQKTLSAVGGALVPATTTTRARRASERQRITIEKPVQEKEKEKEKEKESGKEKEEKMNQEKDESKKEKGFFARIRTLFTPEKNPKPQEEKAAVAVDVPANDTPAKDSENNNIVSTATTVVANTVTGASTMASGAVTGAATVVSGVVDGTGAAVAGILSGLSTAAAGKPMEGVNSAATSVADGVVTAVVATAQGTADAATAVANGLSTAVSATTTTTTPPEEPSKPKKSLTGAVVAEDGKNVKIPILTTGGPLDASQMTDLTESAPILDNEEFRSTVQKYIEQRHPNEALVASNVLSKVIQAICLSVDSISPMVFGPLLVAILKQIGAVKTIKSNRAAKMLLALELFQAFVRTAYETNKKPVPDALKYFAATSCDSLLAIVIKRNGDIVQKDKLDALVEHHKEKLNRRTAFLNAIQSK
jgi:hypothetical protein